MKATINQVLLLGFYIISIFHLSAQSSKQASTWYFGEHAGLDFRTIPPTVLFDGALNVNEGCSAICNPSGQLLFYSDGIQIWNKNHQVIPGATDLGGHFSTTHSCVILQKPGSESQYYVFSLYEKGQGSLQYAVVDMELNNGLGGLVTKNNELIEGCSEKLAIVPHCNGIDFWLLGHEIGTNVFLIWELTEQGISPIPVRQGIGTAHPNGLLGGLGYLKSNMQGTKLALGVYSGNFFEIFDFDNVTGELSNSILITNDEFDQPYGVEFSPDGKRLYLALTQSIRRLYQINLDLPSTEAIQNSLITIHIGGGFFEFGALQLAPDGKIYVAEIFTNNLGIIHNPNGLGEDCNFELSALSLGNRECRLGLPYFSAQYFNFPSEIQIIQTPNYCEASMNIQADVVSPGDSIGYTWYYQDVLLTDESTSQIEVNQNGTYSLKTTIFSKCQASPKEYEKIIEVQIPEPLQIESVSIQDPSCNLSNGSIEVIIQGGQAPFQYSIDEGGSVQGNSIFTGLSDGIYNLLIQDEVGCEVMETVELIAAEPLVFVNIEFTHSTCEEANGKINIQAEGGTGAISYALNNGVYQSNPLFEDLMEGTYNISIQDENRCTVNETINIEGTSQIKITNIQAQSATCSKEDGMFSIEITGGTGPILSSINDGSFTPSLKFENLGFGPQVLQLKDSLGCQIETIVNIGSQDCPLYIPNAFSPNGDGINDTFQVFVDPVFEGEINLFQVYNRWGGLVFEERKLPIEQLSWNGTRNGELLDAGIYLYVLELEKINGERETLKGDLMLLR